MRDLYPSHFKTGDIVRTPKHIHIITAGPYPNGDGWLRIKTMCLDMPYFDLGFGLGSRIYTDVFDFPVNKEILGMRILAKK